MREMRWCGECAAETAFERFECADHAADCVELVCTACGAGIETAGFGAAVPAAAAESAAA